MIDDLEIVIEIIQSAKKSLLLKDYASTISSLNAVTDILASEKNGKAPITTNGSERSSQ